VYLTESHIGSRSICQDKTARIWSVESGECLALLSGHTGAVNYAVFAP